LIFTTNINEIEKNHFHIKVPIKLAKQNSWLNLAFDISSFFDLFQGKFYSKYPKDLFR